MMTEISMLDYVLGPRASLFVRRVAAAFLWFSERLTPRRLWSRYVVPGRLVVVTTSDVARRVIEESLERQRHRRFFRVLEINENTHDDGASSKGEWPPRDARSQRSFKPPLAGAWEVRVARGSERAVLLELELRVSDGLAREAGYLGIDSRLSRLVARRAMTAHQARRVRVSSALTPFAPAEATLNDSARVSLNNSIHSQYLQLLGVPRPTAVPSPGVTVAVLDSAINRDHLLEGVSDRIARGKMSRFVASLPPWDHGAITASIVGVVSPGSRIEAYTVADRDEIVPETSIINSLENTQARVICMCVEFNFHPKRKVDGETAIERTLRGMGPDRIVVVASGNRENVNDTRPIGFPGRCPSVLTVGAVNLDCERLPYSRFVFPDGDANAPLYLMAPGGFKRGDTQEIAVRSGGDPKYGTSVAAAYAAGVIARSIATIEANGGHVDSVLLFETLRKRARRNFAGYETTPDEYGAGLLQCLCHDDEPLGAGVNESPGLQLQERLRGALAAGDLSQLEAMARAIGLDVP
jgi:hypothetical protein